MGVGVVKWHIPQMTGQPISNYLGYESLWVPQTTTSREQVNQFM